MELEAIAMRLLACWGLFGPVDLCLADAVVIADANADADAEALYPIQPSAY